jgi:hypothetical protein
VVAADDDRVTALGEAGHDADVATASAALGYDSADLRGDVLVVLPRQGAIVDVRSSGNFRPKLMEWSAYRIVLGLYSCRALMSFNNSLHLTNRNQRDCAGLKGHLTWAMAFAF